MTARVLGAWLASLMLLLAARPMQGTAATSDWSAVAEAVGRPGSESRGVYRVSFPRTDLLVTVDGTPIKPGLALGGWAAFAREGDATVVDGDLVLLPQEINGVVSVLQANGLEITALHNHLILETPHVMYLHFFGKGDPAALARGLRAALAETATPPPALIAAEPAPVTPAWARAVEENLGRAGTLRGGVLAIGVPRAEQIHEHGATLAPAMGMANAFAFQATESGEVAATGDFVLTGEEVNAVIRELRAGGIRVTALHNHLIRSEPTLYFMHFWATGEPAKIGLTLKQALSHVRVKPD
jgi:uncharacterized protein DUF1259